MHMKEPIGGQLEILSRDDIERIHGATVEVLRRLGVKVWEPKARELFQKAGAEVDRKTLMVRIPESLLKEAIAKAPKEFEMYGRDPSYKLVFGGKRVHFSVAGMGVRVHDLEGRVRPATLSDVENLARLGDHCQNIHHISMMVTPQDVPDRLYPLYMLLANWKNSIKTTDGYNYTASQAMETIEMASILRGGREELMKKPMLLGFTNPVSPMQLSKELIEGAIVYAENNQPMLYAPEALAGGTAPATLAGLLVQQNAEVLSGIMVSQLARPGAPVLYGTVSAALDMRTGATALGGPEVGLLNLATAQLARYYGIPCRGTGGNTDSKVLDAQAGAETAVNLLMAALAGMNFIYDAAGSLEGSLTVSYEKLLVDDEICGMVSRVLAGIEVTEETLAVDEICRVGPNASYLSSPLTARTYRREHFIPTLFDRSSREAWTKAGSRDIAALAREEAKRVLRTHQPEPLEQDVLRDLEQYVKKVAERVRH